MTIKLFSSTTKTLVAAVALAAAGMASANTIIADGSYPGDHASPGAFGVTIFDVPAILPATMSFDLLGFNTLDGGGSGAADWYYKDIFTLSINGVAIFSGSFNMGGGGASTVTLMPTGTTWSTITNGCSGPCDSVMGHGGTTTVTLPISLAAGDNLIKFAYASPGGTYAGPQTIADEGWGVGHYVISSVPEPETYAMLLAGLGIVGAITRRRRKA
jgi:hypothetical protein